MREITCRVWDKQEKKMIYNAESTYDGYPVSDVSSFGELLSAPDFYDVMLYTGLKDINDKKIYGKDIVRFAVPNPTGYESYDGEWVDTTEQEPCGEVVFKDGCYCVKYPNGELLPFNTPTSETNKAPIIELFEVLGNIYENKELLE